MTELQMLLHEKRELERRIKELTTGSIFKDTVKLDRISAPGKYQTGKWALYLKYEHTANVGNWRNSRAEYRSKWQPVVNGDSLDDVVSKIPEVIKALTELYEMAKGEQHGTDT